MASGRPRTKKRKPWEPMKLPSLNSASPHTSSFPLSYRLAPSDAHSSCLTYISVPCGDHIFFRNSLHILRKELDFPSLHQFLPLIHSTVVGRMWPFSSGQVPADPTPGKGVGKRQFRSHCELAALQMHHQSWAFQASVTHMPLS